MQKYFAFFLFFGLPTYLLAQNHATLNLQVFDAQTNKNIKNVKVISRYPLNVGKKNSTDFLGRTTLIPIVGDTITFDHPEYYHLHIVLHDHAPHDFAHPLKVYLTALHESHEKQNKPDFANSSYTSHHFEPQQAHHEPLKIGVIEDERALAHRKSWLEKTRGNPQDFKILDIHLRKKKL